MELNNLSAQAEQYKRELIRLYGRRSNSETASATADEIAEEAQTEAELPEETAADDQPRREDEAVFGVDEEAPDDTTYAPYSEEENSDSPDDETEYNNRYPEPDLSMLGDTGESGYETPPRYVSEESLGEGRGFVLVNVRAGDESTPIEGATVMVTAIVDGSRLILAEGTTDESGTTEKFSLPAPDIKHSQSPATVKRPYNLFDVSVTASGYFNARSVDVPVFDGITSVQNFSMIPVPLMMSGSDETVTYFNQEPDFDAAAAES